MTKQEFMAMSLPYGIKMVSNNGDNNYIAILDGIQNGIYYDEYGSEFNDYKPILHPLPDLTKPIEHKGERFNPSYKLGKEIIGGIDIYKMSNFDLEINIETPDYRTQIDLFNGFLIVQKLVEWHFDIADLLSKGEAIDVNTLEENPYK